LVDSISEGDGSGREATTLLAFSEGVFSLEEEHPESGKRKSAVPKRKVIVE
jgi:hypothetical protein